ncbi:hypothetical protein LTR17_003892 [Elasticomyces elasticus]|nr:hypothetical protein LTR17_003892 [Elasticomyces elasticus]
MPYQPHPPLPRWRISNLKDLVGLQPDEKPTPTLTGLPTELLHNIVTFIHAKRDLRNIIALGNNRLYAVALPELYKSMHFKISDHLQPKIKNMLTRENEGLHHIHHVDIFAGSYHNDESTAYQWLEVMINIIPKNVIKHLRWTVPRSLPWRITHLLWQRQAALEIVEVFPRHHDNHGMPETETDLQDYFKTHEMPNITELRLVPEDTDTALIGSAIMQACNLTTLKVDARSWSEGGAHHDRDVGHVVDPLTSTLFVHITPAPMGQAGTLSTITTLTLSDVDLRYASHTWLRYFNVAQVRHLTLEHCGNVDIILGNMSTSIQKPRLQGLTVVHELGTADRTVDMLDDLLIYSECTLENLQLCLRNAPRLPDVAAVKRHELHCLTLDITGQQPPQRTAQQDSLSMFYDDEDLESLLEHPNPSALYQLGLHLPPQSFEYKSFPQTNTPFIRALDIIIRKVCDIYTLNIINWPENYKNQNYGSAGYYASKVPSLARLAADVFGRFRHYDFNTDNFVKDDLGCRLEVVSFGVREHDDRQPSLVHFVEGEITALGRTRLTAERQKLSNLITEDLEVDILNYDARRWSKQARSEFYTFCKDEEEAVDEDEY